VSTLADDGSKDPKQEQHLNNTTHNTMKEFVCKIVSILEDSDAFTNKKEGKIKVELKSAYLIFAEIFGLNPDIEIRGMRSGLGGLCGANPNSYLITSVKGEMFKIWLTRKYREPQQVQITMPAKFNNVEKMLTDELKKVGIEVTSCSEKETQQIIKEYRYQSRKFESH
jgi:hypothetical protein